MLPFKGNSQANPSKGKGPAKKRSKQAEAGGTTKRQRRAPVSVKEIEKSEEAIKPDGYQSDEDDIRQDPRVGNKRWNDPEEYTLSMAVSAEKTNIKESFDVSLEGNKCRKLAWRRVRNVCRKLGDRKITVRECQNKVKAELRNLKYRYIDVSGQRQQSGAGAIKNPLNNKEHAYVEYAGIQVFGGIPGARKVPICLPDGTPILKQNVDMRDFHDPDKKPAIEYGAIYL